MNVGELKEMLSRFPDETEILNGRWSDWQVVSEDEWNLVMGVEKDGWVMRSHPTMSDAEKKVCKAYLALDGN